MKGVRRMCPSCWKHNRAIALGCRESPRRCFFCGAELLPAPEVLGVNWQAILKGKAA